MRLVALFFVAITPTYSAFALPPTGLKAGLNTMGKKAETNLKMSSRVEHSGSSGQDDDDAIAYAWFAEDETREQTKRKPWPAIEVAKDSADDDDAIAYAWFADDDA